MLTCERCGKQFKGAPSSGKKYCSKACRKGEITAICKCGKTYTTWPAKKAPKTCGDNNCSKSRSHTQATKDKIATTLGGDDRIKGVYHRTCKCGTEFTTQKPLTKCCENCRRHPPAATPIQCRIGAYKSLAINNRQSKIEIKFGQLIPQGYAPNDRDLLKGYEIDYLYENLAVEYHGAWHYKNFHQHYESTRLRDKNKAKILKEKKIQHYIVGWAENYKPPQEFLQIHAYNITQLFKEISPFKFLYTPDLFEQELKNLNKTKGQRGYLCTNLIDYYHSYRWAQKTKTHNQNAHQHWEANKEKVIQNRLKYSTTKPRDLRRYYLLFDYTPSTFSEVHAKVLANEINGDHIIDPFAGYGNRMIGVTAAGKTYEGYDINPLAVNANNLIAHDFDLNASCTRADSSKLDDLVADGLITCPPYGDKDEYGVESEKDFYDMIRDTFKSIKLRDKGFVIIKPNLVNIRLFEKALGKIKAVKKVDWSGLGRSSLHNVYII